MCFDGAWGVVVVEDCFEMQIGTCLAMLEW
jgi:hypothetical protein